MRDEGGAGARVPVAAADGRAIRDGAVGDLGSGERPAAGESESDAAVGSGHWFAVGGAVGGIGFFCNTPRYIAGLICPMRVLLNAVMCSEAGSRRSR